MDLTLLNTVPLPVLGFVFVGLAVAIAVGGLLVVRRFVAHHQLEEHNDVAGFIYAVVGVIYAIVLAFVVIVVWELFRDTEGVVEKEAGSLASLYRQVQIYTSPEQLELRRQIYLYALSVVHDEWPEIRNGNIVGSQKTRNEYDAIWDALRKVQPTNANEQSWQTEMLESLSDVAEGRRFRLTHSATSIPGIMWTMLLVGGAITVAYTYLYGVKNIIGQALMTGALAALIALILLLIFTMDHPFSGDVAVEPTPFEREITSFERQMRTQGIPFPAPGAH